jgi:hypothetical protein
VTDGRGRPDGSRTPAVLETTLAGLVVLCSLASLAYRDAVGARPAPDDVARLLTLYTSVASGLPPGERIGFVSSVADRARSTAMLYLAQNALAPRLLDPGLAGVSHVISTPSAPESLDDDPRLTDFHLIGRTPEGVRIYRRQR